MFQAEEEEEEILAAFEREEKAGASEAAAIKKSLADMKKAEAEIQKIDPKKLMD